MASSRGQRRGDLDGVDDASAQLIISLQLQDISEEEKKSNGYKPPLSKERNALAANLLYRRNLQELETNINDRHLAESMARAVVEDASVIANLVREEERAREDRSMAISMAPRQPNTGLSPALPQVEEHHGELLARMASMYVSRNTGRALMPNDVLERETQRRGNQGQANQQSHQCIICFENKSYFDVLTVPCNHDYCGPCLQELFSEAYRDESLFPPRCCRTTIPVNLTSIELFLPRQLRDPYETRRIETTTQDRTYCSNTYCGRFILPTEIFGKRAPCTACLTLTCGGCKKGYHTGSCNRDEAKEKTLELAAQMGWRRCNGCQQMVELAHGCNHMCKSFPSSPTHHDNLIVLLQLVRAAINSATSAVRNGSPVGVVNGMSLASSLAQMSSSIETQISFKGQDTENS